MGDFLFIFTAMYMQLLKILIGLFVALPVFAQNIGGKSVFQFAQLPAFAQLSSLGGVNVSVISNDESMHVANPALLRNEMHAQMATSFNSMYAGIKQYGLSGAYFNTSLKTNIAATVQYVDYGSISATDAAGNILGNIRPQDYMMQLAISRKYLKKWHYGFAFKYMNANYGNYKAAAIAMDAGANYYDSAKQFQVGLVMKNMGVVLRDFTPGISSQMPLDIQLGFSKKLANAPLQFSFTAHHLHQFNILYNDTSFNNENGFPSANDNKGFSFGKLVQHFVIAAQGYIGNYVVINTGYHFLRRKELSIPNTPNGFTGFSLGLDVLLKKWQIHYGRSYYQSNTAYNQFGINLSLN